MRELLDKVLDTFRRRKRKYRYRSSVTGLFVSREYAEANPDTTQRFEVK